MKASTKEIAQAIAKKFDIPLKDLVTLEVDGKTVVLDGRSAGTYKGSWNDIMNAPLKDYKITVDGVAYDCRTGMSWKVYKAFQDSLEDKVDKLTWTLLTGEPIPEWLNHYFGASHVPYGFWNGGQVESYLDGAGDQDGDGRVRLAVIINDLEISPSSSALNFPPLRLEVELKINGEDYVLKDKK